MEAFFFIWGIFLFIVALVSVIKGGTEEKPWGSPEGIITIAAGSLGIIFFVIGFVLLEPPTQTITIGQATEASQPVVHNVDPEPKQVYLQVQLTSEDSEKYRLACPVCSHQDSFVFTNALINCTNCESILTPKLEVKY